MATVRVRLIGGALSGKVLWVEGDRPLFEVYVAAGAGVQKTLTYQIDGETASFVGESDSDRAVPKPTNGKKKQ